MKISDDLKNNNNTLMSRINKNWYFISVWFLSAFFILNKIIVKFFDNDVYHILASGRAICNNGVIKEDVFFVDSGHKITIQQWLHNVIIYKLYSSCGKIGLLFFVLVLAVLVVLLSVRFMKYYDIDIRLSLTSVFFICIFANSLFTVRPQILTIILLLIQLIIVEEYKKNGRLYPLFFLPVLTLIEINLHATMWIAHFIFLLPYIVPVPAFLKSKIKVENNNVDIKKLLLPMFLMLISLFINPYGLDGITILFKQKEISGLNIIELSSPTLLSRHGIVLIMMLLVTVFAYGKTKIHSSNLFLFLGTTLLMMAGIRNYTLFSMGIIAILCDLLPNLPLTVIEKKLSNTKKSIVLLCDITVIAIIAMYFLTIPFGLVLNDAAVDGKYTPVLAVEYLNEHANKDSRIYTDFNNGAYVSWCEYKIYFCSRTEGYCKDINGGYDLVSEYKTIAYNYNTDCSETYDAFLQKYNFDYLIVDVTSRMFPYMCENNNFEEVVRGNSYIMFKTK